MRNVPGRKTDVQDCVWIAQWLEHGLLRGSFVPPVGAVVHSGQKYVPRTDARHKPVSTPQPGSGAIVRS
jgi:hypothetical protein